MKGRAKARESLSPPRDLHRHHERRVTNLSFFARPLVGQAFVARGRRILLAKEYNQQRQRQRTMMQRVRPTIREVLLAEITAQEPTGYSGSTLQQNSVLEAAARKLGAIQNPELEQAILTQWSELFRTGLLAWGLNLSNPNPPFFHLTERGQQALRNLTRDPSNPSGYMRHLTSIAALGPIAMSYLEEGLECYVAGLFRASAVLVGAAAESIILDLRDATVQKLTALKKPMPRGMDDWRIKTVSDALRTFFALQVDRFSRELKEPFEAYWSAFAQQIRAARNDAGHPASVKPVTPDTVHASLLIFPELARLANHLSRWVEHDLT